MINDVYYFIKNHQDELNISDFEIRHHASFDSMSFNRYVGTYYDIRTNVHYTTKEYTFRFRAMLSLLKLYYQNSITKI